jgi:spermidine/putrescine transport system ATP-binding protein
MLSASGDEALSAVPSNRDWRAEETGRITISVDIRGLVKHHGATRAVDDVSLSVLRGEFFSILGPSGSGKTTLLRLLAGFERPDDGEILIEGHPMAHGGRQGGHHGFMVPPNRRPVNLVFQTYALFPHLTVFENIAFGLRMRQWPADEIRKSVAGVLDMVRLDGKENRFPSQLSGGEQQRVALARALVNRPAVLLLDEPLSALDQQLRQEMQLELKAIQEQVGITFLYVTHHQEEALTMSDRLAVMHEGRLLQVGTPQELYEAPASAFVASFIGVSNRLRARIATVEGSRCLLIAPGLPRIVSRPPARAAEGREVMLSIRPERIHLTPLTETASGMANTEAFDNSVPGRVAKALYSGSDMLYLVCFSSGVTWKCRVANGGGDQKRFLPGETVSVRWNADEGVTLLE